MNYNQVELLLLFIKKCDKKEKEPETKTGESK